MADDHSGPTIEPFARNSSTMRETEMSCHRHSRVAMPELHKLCLCSATLDRVLGRLVTLQACAL